MRIVLMHNPRSGSGSPTAAQLVELLTAAGHRVHYQSSKAQDYPAALDEPADLLLIAGGDGTVAKVLRRLTRRDLPVAILPLGTSNNIAASLGLRARPEAFVAGLATAERRALDVGTARAPWGEGRFVESAGLGLFARLLALPAPAGENRRKERKDNLAWGLERFRALLARGRPRPHRIEADGEDLSADYLLVLAMNIGCIGPRVWLAPDAVQDDGRLELVLAHEADREALDAYLVGLREGRGGKPPLASRRVRRVRLDWDADTGHLDDQPWGPAEPEGLVELAITEPPVAVLVPPTPPDELR